MRERSGAALVLIFAAATSASQVHATTFDFSTSVALSPSFAFSGGYLQSGLAGAPITVQAGDTITGTIDLTGGSLSLAGQVNWLDFDFLGNASTQWTSNVTLLGVIGTIGQAIPVVLGLPVMGLSVQILDP
jgi:hypothetical protein